MPEPAMIEQWLSALADVKKTWPTRGWSFDNRFMCVASTFRSDVAPQARSAIASVLPTQWTEASLTRGPAEIRDIAKRTGGIRAGQFLFSHAIDGPVIAYGLWWPWEEGNTISLRVGLDGAGDMTLRLCSALSIEP